MLYLMNVNWHWIKQRPHFLAIHLSRFFELSVFYPSSARYLLKGNNAPSNFRGLFQLPFGRFVLIRKINNFIYYFLLKKQLKDADILWISDPRHFAVISDLVSPEMIVFYDCMDDVVAFGQREGMSAVISQLEGRLVERANHIVVSSQKLKSVLINRYHAGKKIEVVNNAIDNSLLESKLVNKSVDFPAKRENVDLLYIGTISDWFDFPLLVSSLNRHQELRLILIGPLFTELPSHDRIIHLGKKAHEDLPAFMNKADALVMPFIINDLIQAVNPVKLYEYIVSEKPIITCDYSEMKNFDDFIYTYNSSEQFEYLIKKLFEGDLMVKSRDERVQFLSDNVWGKRAETIAEILINGIRIAPLRD